ncbi:MAG: phosphatase PAP2 family protein [Comamonadaceae bacterium]|jgi:membrane-associated PAP2 superfamily phosphatase|nr:phosphatase PAP2 family protein [Comamonadaceae bacterium]
MQTHLPSVPLRASRLPAGLWGLLLALGALLAWDASGLDLWAMHHVGDATGFAWREHWLTTQLVHQGGRLLSWAAIAFILLANLRPRQLLPELTRSERLGWLLTTLLCLAVVSLIKRASLTSCPWDLAEFGGTAHYISHWAFGLRDGGGGRCFPSGHASAAFAFLGGAWVLARAYPRLAQAWLAGVIVLGVVFGTGQMLRGAHYPSHTMWTAWICWAITFAVVQIQPRIRSRRAVA